MAIQFVSIKANEELVNKVIAYYRDFQFDNANEYIIFFAKFKDISISIFRSNKTENFKIVFQGENALEVARKFDNTATANITSSIRAKEAKEWECLFTQIGSDEVGTGDFFAPICVCASYIEAKDINFLRELGVDDSKKLSDDEIREIAPILIAKFDYSQLSVSNEKFNELTLKGLNMNEIKAKMHNQVLLNLSKKHPLCENVFLDEFVNENKYYEYLKSTPEIKRNITFRMKGESAYPSVAVGSIIARFSLLQKLDALNNKYKVNFPLGASNKVNEFAKEFVEIYGIEELNKICKKNFANYNEIIANDDVKLI